VSTIQNIPAGTENSDLTGRCASCSTERTQNGICGICAEKFTDYSDVVPDHISPRGMGGAWRDDHPDNIQAVHWWCNGEKGSSRS
jgi:hypothetical protein